jgi:hypothetical protein
MLPLLALLVASNVASLAVNLYQGNEVRQENKKVNAENTKARILKARQDRTAALKERMTAQANLAVQAAATGTVGSSGAVGAESSVQSQFGNAYAFSEATDLFGRNAAVAQGKAQKAEYRGSIANTIFNSSNTLMSVGHSQGWFEPKLTPAPMSVPKVTSSLGK